jgi:D-alanine-D-alanine ligase
VKKINVGIVFGGISAEHEVSIKSAISIVKNLKLNKYNPIPIYVDIKGNWNFIDLLAGSNDLILYLQKCINEIKKQLQNNNKTSYFIDSNKLKQLVDVVLPIIHGKTGEDGIIQGFFELLNLPYVSSNILSSSITMDKEFTKILLKEKGIQVVPYMSIKEYQYNDKEKKNDLIEYIKKSFSLPLFIKPVNCGSSIGIQKVINLDGLKKSISNAFRYDNKILIEQEIDAKEIEISILENIEDYEQPIVSMPGIIIPNDEFYTYKAKYIMKDGAKFEIPALIDDNLSNSIRSQAKNIFKILECNCLARVDFFLENNTNKLFFNEINTIPGFTEISLYPKLLDNYGIMYSELLDKLIALSFKKHNHNNIKNHNAVDILNYVK